MLSKSLGQILRALDVLFKIPTTEDSATVCNTSDDYGAITKEAIEAAIDFVDVCCQQAAYIAGRGKIEDEIDLVLGKLLFIKINFLSIL